MLSRQAITTGGYRDSLGSLSTLRWTEAQIRDSLSATLAHRPSNAPVWVFAYGSLIWNPLMKFEEQRPASLEGYRRSFCLRTIASRGSAELPGRMLSLEPGGRTCGIAYRVREEVLVEELELMWVREMIAGVYVPTWVSLSLEAGESVLGLAFIANPTHPLYDADVAPATVGPIAAVATGVLGANASYVQDLEKALLACNIADPYVTDVADAMRRELERLAQ